MQEQWLPFVVVAVAAACVLVVGTIVAAIVLRTNKPSAKQAVLSGRIGLLETPLPRDSVFAKLKGASLGRFKFADADDQKKVLVFESRLTVFSWGFFFPVFLT